MINEPSKTNGMISSINQPIMKKARTDDSITGIVSNNNNNNNFNSPPPSNRGRPPKIYSSTTNGVNPSLSTNNDVRDLTNKVNEISSRLTKKEEESKVMKQVISTQVKVIQELCGRISKLEDQQENLRKLISY